MIYPSICDSSFIAQVGRCQIRCWCPKYWGMVWFVCIKCKNILFSQETKTTRTLFAVNISGRWRALRNDVIVNKSRPKLFPVTHRVCETRHHLSACRERRKMKRQPTRSKSYQKLSFPGVFLNGLTVCCSFSMHLWHTTLALENQLACSESERGRIASLQHEQSAGELSLCPLVVWCYLSRPVYLDESFKTWNRGQRWTWNEVP